MSVTFTAEMSPITAWAFTCAHPEEDNGVTGHRFGSYQEAEAFLLEEQAMHGGTGHLATCGDEYCAYSGMFFHTIESDPAPEVNVSIFNAVHILNLLGIPATIDDELVGSMDPTDFLGRILMAEAINPADAGVPATLGGEQRLIRRPGRRQ